MDPVVPVDVVVLAEAVVPAAAPPELACKQPVTVMLSVELEDPPLVVVLGLCAAVPIDIANAITPAIHIVRFIRTSGERTCKRDTAEQLLQS